MYIRCICMTTMVRLYRLYGKVNINYNTINFHFSLFINTQYIKTIKCYSDYTILTILTILDLRSVITLHRCH